MNTQTQEALKMAIEELNYYFSIHPEDEKLEEAIQACKEAIAQPAQEPVAWISESTLKHSVEYRNRFDDAKSWAEIRAVDRKTTNCDVPLYTHPAPSWQGLESEKVTQIIHGLEDKLGMPIVGAIAVARAIEQELKTKNGFSDVKEKNHG